jgi:hypothetical protein
VFVDETGLTRGDDPENRIFAAVAVIVRDEDQPIVDREVRGWQERWLGRPRYVHELDVRKRTGSFHLAGDVTRQNEAFAEYTELLRSLPYRLLAVAIEKDELTEFHPDGRIDGYLPGSLYPLSVQLLFERVVHCLNWDDDRLGRIEAEGVGQTEDALLQQSFSALKLRGTRFHQEAWFRYQLGDYVAFYGKAHNRPGLQLADWVARPIAEAVMCARARENGAELEHHACWAAIASHLYDGHQSRPDTFGLKIYPQAPYAMRRYLFPGADLDRAADWAPKKLRGPAAEAVDP